MSPRIADLSHYAVLRVTGDDRAAFLHAQFTNDVEALAVDAAQWNGWCTPKGRLVATFLLVRRKDEMLIVLPAEIAAPIAKRLGMFVLRSKVKIADVTAAWSQLGAWGDVAGETFSVHQEGDMLIVKVGEGRSLRLSPGEAAGAFQKTEAGWALAEIQAGRPLITAATQDQFVPQMVNLEALGGVNFQKGCYPGQEIVARAQYRGQGVKRRMVKLPAPPGEALKPGQEFNGGVVVDSAGGEVLAVMPL